MSTRLRSSSVGAGPRPRLQRPSRSESAAAVALDVRCACQFFQTKSLLPERVNPVGYNPSEEFEPCVHIQAHLKDPPQPTPPQSDSDIGYPITAASVPYSNIMPDQLVMAPAPPTNVYGFPAEFAVVSQDENKSSNIMNALGNRSASCANMGGRSQTPQFMKQRDPSTSSLLRKRMSEERQGFPVLAKRLSDTSTTSQFIAQKDLSQSNILRRKMSNQSTSSFERARSELIDRAPFKPTRIPNERTFYHDSNDFVRNSNVDCHVTKMEVTSPMPLTLQAQGNRRFMLSSNENISGGLHGKTSTETEPDSGIDSTFIDDPPRKTERHKHLLKNANVSDEEKVKILLSNLKQDLGEMNASQGPPKAPPRHKMQLVNVEEVKTVEMPTPMKVQYITRPENIPRLQVAQTSDHSYSKLLDNYDSTLHLSRVSNASTPDLHLNYIKQRDPSQSRFTQNRYKSSKETTPISMPSTPQAPMQFGMDHRDKLLPPVGDFPERRASEVISMHSQQPEQPKTDHGLQYIRQKDLRTSTVLNRRRRNLSQSSLGHDTPTAQQAKITKTLSFEKNLLQSDSDQISPYTGTSIKMVKGVSFEHEKRPASSLSDRNEQNTFDFLHAVANKRPHRYQYIFFNVFIEIKFLICFFAQLKTQFVICVVFFSFQ